MLSTNHALPALVVTVLVLTAGCAGMIGDEISGEEIADRVEDRHEDIEDVQGVVTVEMTSGNETDRTTQEVWERPPDEYRTEVIESTGAGSAGDVTVTNGSTTWSYDSEAGEVTTFESDVDVETEPMDAAFVEDLVENFEFEYEGTATVADRDAHVIDLTPATNETDALYENATVWIDEEYWYPIKQDVTVDISGGERMRMTTTYEEIAFNEGIDDEMFAFDPPEDATVVEDRSFEERTFEDREAAAAEAPFDLPDVAIPDAYEFETASITEFEGNVTVSEEYVDGDGSIWLSVSAGGEPTTTDPDREDAGAVDASVEEVQGTTFVEWGCDGLSHSLWSESVGEETLLEIAESAGCE